MPDECKKAWWKLDPFFDFFRNLICDPISSTMDNSAVKSLTKQHRQQLQQYFIE